MLFQHIIINNEIIHMGRQRAPDWNCLHQGCGSRLDPDPGARKIRNFSGKIALFSYCFKKILQLKGIK
jgi:hypothetical protein